MQGLKMRPMPEPEQLPKQSALLRRLQALKNDGLGWEDIAIKLRAEKMPVSDSHVRAYVLRG